VGKSNTLATKKVFLVDFEFRQQDGGRPSPLCLVVKEWPTGQTQRIWLESNTRSPFNFGNNVLVVAFYASAEIGCLLELGWDLPSHVLDLYPEFRLLISGGRPTAGFGLLGALMHFGLSGGVTEARKEEMRGLAQQESLSEDEKSALLTYCEGDVTDLGKLLTVMQTRIDFPRALIRGRYMVAAARIERAGIPVDTKTLCSIKSHWQDFKGDLIAAIDADFGVFVNDSFNAQRWLAWCERKKIPWPLHPSGQPKLDDDTFRDMAKIFPEILPMKELRVNLGQLRLQNLAVGADGRNRYLLSAFGSVTSRNQPSTSKGIFGPATWFRFLIKPLPGRALAYLDYEQQEFGIGASLSGDKNMKEAYASGDPYLTFAKQAGAVPPNATKKSHPGERDLYKTCALGVQYGIGQASLGVQLNLTAAHGRELIEKHKQVYRIYWRWSDAIEARAMLGWPLVTAFGWRTVAGSAANPRSLRNFPLQANGAEMLRVACIALTEAGITVCAPVHDAVLIEAAENEIEEMVATAKHLMERASRAVLGDFTLRTEEKIIRWPDRFSDPRVL
jgi:hypothetical protein